MNDLDKVGITLKEVQKKAKKQSSNPKALGWFQRFNTGNSFINNKIFNQGTGPAETSSDGEIATADGGVGAVGTMGESMEDKTRFFFKRRPKMHIGDEQDLTSDSFVTKLVVDKEDIITALKDILRYNEEFVDYSDEDFNAYINANWKNLKNEYFSDLHDYFDNKDNTSNLKDNYFYDDDVEISSDEDEEIDEDLTHLMLEDIDSDDPTFEPEYDKIYSNFDEEPQTNLSTLELDDLQYDAYSYGLEFENSNFDSFLDSINIYLTPKEIDKVRDAYNEGKKDRDAQLNDLDECAPTYLESNQDNRHIDPYADDDTYADYDDEFLDNFAGYDSELLDIKDKKHPYAGYLGSDDLEEDENFEYDDTPLQESAMSDLDLDTQDPEFIEKLEKNIQALEDELEFLENQAPKEVRRGGAFDSQEEIDAAIDETVRELKRERAKLAIIQRRHE